MLKLDGQKLIESVIRSPSWLIKTPTMNKEDNISSTDMKDMKKDKSVGQIVASVEIAKTSSLNGDPVPNQGPMILTQLSNSLSRKTSHEPSFLC